MSRMRGKTKDYFDGDDPQFNGIIDSLALKTFTVIWYVTKTVVTLQYRLYRKIKRAACFRCRSIMKPQTKRSLCLGIFLVIVTLVVLYSYCNGSSVCYTFPFLNGLDRDRLVTKPQAEVVVTSVIVQTKQPFEMTTTPKEQKGSNYETSVTLSELHTKTKQEVEQRETPNVTDIAEKLHFHRNRTYFERDWLNRGEEQNNITQGEKIHELKKHLLPPSDIVGKVAEEILRRANVSEEEANRELIRVEKVDEYVDREREQRRRMKQQGQSLLEKVKESRNTGGKSKEKKLVRVERVDLTDEEEEEGDVQPERPVKPASEARFQERAKPNGESINASKVEKSSRMVKANKTLMSEDYKSSYERRFGKTNEVNTTQESNTSAVKKDENNLDFNINKTGHELAITPPPFFAKFLKVTAKEREMIDFLHNYTDSNGTLGRRVLNITQQKNGNEKEQHNMAQRLNIAFAQAHTDKIHARHKRDHKEGGLRDTLQPLIAKLLGPHNGSEDLKGSFNLSNILGKLTDGSQNLVTKDNKQTSDQDSTALLVKFLQQGSRYRSGAPKNDTSMHTDRDYVKVVGAKLGIHKSVQQTPLDGAVNLKKTLLELADHINLTRKHNYSTTTSENQEKKADLTILKLLLNKSTWQDFSVFNLSRVLNEIAGSSLKVKRHENADDLGSSRAESNLKIVRPVADRLENSKPMLVLNTGRKQSNSLKSEEALAPKNVNVTSVDMGSRENHALLSNGFGSGEPGDEGSRSSVDFDKQKNKNFKAKEKSEKKERSKLGTNGILKFDTIRCDALDPKVLLYNRIFKTGSSTTEFIIMNSSSRMNYDYKIGTTEDWYDEGKSHPYPGLIIRKANKKLMNYPRMTFMAHFYFRRNLNLPQAHTYINQVRDPVRRLVSHYHYMRSNNRPAYRIKEFRASGEKDESLEKCFRLQHKGCQNNVMTRFFCGRHFYCRRGNGRALHKAMNNIKRFYATVGLLENYDVYLQILHKRLPKFFPKSLSQDISKFKYNPKYSFNDIPKELIRDITRANWADVKLYSFVKKRFWKQAKACGIGTKLN